MKRNKKWFTLMELIVVMVVIGVLSTALVPRLVSLQNKARDVKRINDVRTIGQWMEVYKADKGKYPTRRDNFTNLDEGSSTWQYAYVINSNFRIWYSSNVNGWTRCVFDNMVDGATTAKNRRWDCTSTITIHDLLVPKYLNTLPRAPKKYVVGPTRAPSITNNVWQAWSYRDDYGVETAPTDFYGYIVVNKWKTDFDSAIVYTPVEYMQNANWINLWFNVRPDQYAEIMPNRVHWPEMMITENPMSIMWSTPVVRWVEKVQYEICRRIVVQALGEPVPLMGWANGGTCYLPTTTTTPFTNVGTPIQEQHLRYLHIQ